MKNFIYVLMALALGVILYNITKLDSDNFLQGDSSVAVFGILSGLCAIVVLSILLISKKIATKTKK